MPVKVHNPIRTETALIGITDAGIVWVAIDAGERQTLADAKSNLAAAISAAGTSKRPLLVDIRLARMLDPESRHYYAGTDLNENFIALAILLETSPLGVMMGNIYSRIARHKVPMRLFQDEEQAKAWLLKQ